MGKTRTSKPTQRRASARSKRAHLLAGGQAGHRSGSHDGNRWLTPSFIVSLVKASLGGIIHLDPATEPGNPTGALSRFTVADDGLSKNWTKFTTIFINPPYSTLKPWIDKAIEASHAGCEVILLLPVRTDAEYHQRLLCEATDFILIRGRLKFGRPEAEGESSAMFGSMLVGLNHSVADLKHLGVLVKVNK